MNKLKQLAALAQVAAQFQELDKPEQVRVMQERELAQRDRQLDLDEQQLKMALQMQEQAKLDRERDSLRYFPDDEIMQQVVAPTLYPKIKEGQQAARDKRLRQIVNLALLQAEGDQKVAAEALSRAGMPWGTLTHDEALQALTLLNQTKK